MVSVEDLEVLAAIAVDASAVIMSIRDQGFTSSRKADNSIVTQADEAAEALIHQRLGALWPATPVMAEEAMAAGHAFDLCQRYFCVDPLDGTREFAAGGDDFTVNIALMDAGVPVAGVIHVCVTGELYLGAVGVGAWRAVVVPGGSSAAAHRQPIRTRPYPAEGLTAVVSKSHLDPKTRALLDHPSIHTSIAAGSSLKFCRVAEGAADLYPRFGPTMEWDTAAGHAVLTAAGGSMVTPYGTAFHYGKVETDFTNGAFMAWGGVPLTNFSEAVTT